MFQEHKFKIVRHAIKNIWLLIFPVLRAVRSFTLDFDAFYNWITGVWIDVFVILVIIGFGYFRWTLSVSSAFFSSTASSVPGPQPLSLRQNRNDRQGGCFEMKKIQV